MNKSRGAKLIYVRRNLPSQEEFVDFLRSRTSVDLLARNSNLKRSLIEHWFRRDKNGFAYPSAEDWNQVKWLVDDQSLEFSDIDYKLNDISIETDDIMKNCDKGRIKRAVWSISTKASPVKHFATYPEELIKTPILSSSQENGIVLDMFMGSGTTGVVCKRLNRNFIGIELNPEYFNIAVERIKNEEQIRN
jgi:DNA modification methylase